eukprot:TRINITY_DN1014_c0_g1_i1.p1 TRINITY_DN1014_c0_g1~~TRINITY_DN1014_c0_g1_i1.p1  ORF type:complete len:113 (+),score=20.92 TRINITY_DN1014_c0_g1_i1:202-540(+)
MPKLPRNDPHQGPISGYVSIRCNLKQHLTTAGKKGPRCPQLKTVIPPAVWTKKLIPYYAKNGPRPDLSKTSSQWNENTKKDKKRNKKRRQKRKSNRTRRRTARLRLPRQHRG